MLPNWGLRYDVVGANLGQIDDHYAILRCDVCLSDELLEIVDHCHVTAHYAAKKQNEETFRYERVGGSGLTREKCQYQTIIKRCYQVYLSR